MYIQAIDYKASEVCYAAQFLLFHDVKASCELFTTTFQLSWHLLTISTRAPEIEYMHHY